MYPHRIRLRGPWEYQQLDRTGDNPPPSGRIALPCAPGDLANLTGRWRFKRSFGYPGRIDSHERVWLTFSGVKAPLELALNRIDLGRQESDAAMDVSHLLGPRNEVTADLDLNAGAGLWEEAALEVRCSAYLRGVRVESIAGKIHVRGEVVGSSEGPLELYLIAGRSPAGYEPAPLAGGVYPFDLSTDAVNSMGEPVDRVKIDLVQGASVWYTVEWTAPAG
jgi:hypothetical protein